mgnify:CR=1 FL=1
MSPRGPPAGFDAVLAQISEGATGRDANPAFPHRPFRILSEADCHPRG